MNRIIQPIFLKFHARRAMQGNFFKTLFASMIPALIMTGVMLAIMLVPSVQNSVKMVTNGIFETSEAQQLYTINVLNNLLYGVNLVSVLFYFLTIGVKKFCLNQALGKEAKIKDVFSFYDKWYVALIYPLFTLAVCFGLDRLLILGGDLPVAEAFVIELIVMAVQLGLFVIEFKMTFLPYALAENGCSSFIKAVKHSWKLTNLKTFATIFLLYISFSGWFFLAMLTTGVALIYAYPYLEMSVATLYAVINNPVKYATNPN